MANLRDTELYIEAMMQQVRDMVVSVQDEQDGLSRRLSRIVNDQNIHFQHNKRHSTSSSSPHILTASSTGQHSTTSSGTPSNANSSSSNRPPSYKSATRNLSLVGALRQSRSEERRLEREDRDNSPPQPPVRHRRRNHTLQTRFMSVARGAFIVFEGLDRVGKSTLVKQLTDHLKRIHHPVYNCRFPDRSTKIGETIDYILKNNSEEVEDHVLHLQFSANRWEFSETIKNKIAKGITVIADRFAYSGVAYSSAKDLSFKWCCDTERGLPKPDLIIYLEISESEQYARQGFGDERFETRAFQKLVRARYEKLINLGTDNWLRIDATDKGPEALLSEIIVPVKRCLESCGYQKLGAISLDPPSESS